MMQQEWLMRVGLTILVALSFAVVALSHTQLENHAWVVAASLCIYVCACQFHARDIPQRAFSTQNDRACAARCQVHPRS
jgi:hypothetical protein